MQKLGRYFSHFEKTPDESLDVLQKVAELEE
jgi:hypothetical protein